MISSRIRHLKYQSPLASFLSRNDVRKKMESNKKAGTLARIVFNDLPNCDYLHPLFAICDEAANKCKKNYLISNLMQADKKGDYSFQLPPEIAPQINAWVNLACAKAMLDLFTVSGNLRYEIKQILAEFKFEEEYSEEDIKKRLFIGYLLHMGSHFDEKKQGYYGITIQALAIKQKELQNRGRSITEIKEKLCANLFNDLENNDITSQKLKREIKTTLLNIYVDNLYETNEAYLKAYRELHKDIIDKNHENDPRQPVLAEVKNVYDDINWQDLDEAVKKISLLTKVLITTAQGSINQKEYSDLIREVSEHAWGKRLAGAMCCFLTTALIASAAVLALTITGPAVPFIIIGLSCLTVGSMISSGNLLFEGFKRKPIADAMKQIRDKPQADEPPANHVAKI